MSFLSPHYSPCLPTTTIRKVSHCWDDSRLNVILEISTSIVLYKLLHMQTPPEFSQSHCMVDNVTAIFMIRQGHCSLEREYYTRTYRLASERITSMPRSPDIPKSSYSKTKSLSVVKIKLQSWESQLYRCRRSGQTSCPYCLNTTGREDGV